MTIMMVIMMIMIMMALVGSAIKINTDSSWADVWAPSSMCCCLFFHHTKVLFFFNARSRAALIKNQIVRRLEETKSGHK